VINNELRISKEEEMEMKIDITIDAIEEQVDENKLESGEEIVLSNICSQLNVDEINMLVSKLINKFNINTINDNLHLTLI
jgi:hypothetical protein